MNAAVSHAGMRACGRVALARVRALARMHCDQSRAWLVLIASR